MRKRQKAFCCGNRIVATKPSKLPCGIRTCYTKVEDFVCRKYILVFTGSIEVDEVTIDGDVVQKMAQVLKLFSALEGECKKLLL